MRNSGDENYSRKIASYLKLGWKLTEYTCPVCGGLIVRKDDEFYCPICEKRVLVAESQDEALNIYKESVLKRLEAVILGNIEKMVSKEIYENELDTLIQYIKILKEIKTLLE